MCDVMRREIINISKCDIMFSAFFLIFDKQMIVFLFSFLNINFFLKEDIRISHEEK